MSGGDGVEVAKSGEHPFGGRGGRGGGLVDNGEPHTFAVVPDKGWKSGTVAGGTEADAMTSGAAATVVQYRRFPRFARFEGRKVEVALQVGGVTGIVRVVAGKQLDTETGRAQG